MTGVHAPGIFFDALWLVSSGGDDGGLSDESRHRVIVIGSGLSALGSGGLSLKPHAALSLTRQAFKQGPQRRLVTPHKPHIERDLRIRMLSHEQDNEPTRLAHEIGAGKFTWNVFTPLTELVTSASFQAPL